MTLFKRTEGTLDELDKVLASFETDTGADMVDKKRRLDEMTEMADTLAQNCSKLRKAAQESDPAKVGEGGKGARAVGTCVQRVWGGRQRRLGAGRARTTLTPTHPSVFAPPGRVSVCVCARTCSARTGSRCAKRCSSCAIDSTRCSPRSLPSRR